MAEECVDEATQRRQEEKTVKDLNVGVPKTRDCNT